MKWAAENARGLGGNPDKLFVMGHSAGAHIAVMLAMDRQYLAAVGMSPDHLRGAIGLAGPYDFLPLSSSRLKEIFGEPEQWPRSQPVNFVSGSAPAMLLATGDEDDIVLPKNTRNLAAKLRAAGGAVKEITYPKVGHRSIVVGLAAPFRDGSPVLKDVADFIHGSGINSAAVR